MTDGEHKTARFRIEPKDHGRGGGTLLDPSQDARPEGLRPRKKAVFDSRTMVSGEWRQPSPEEWASAPRIRRPDQPTPRAKAPAKQEIHKVEEIKTNDKAIERWIGYMVLVTILMVTGIIAALLIHG